MSEKFSIDKQAHALLVLDQFDVFQKKNAHCDFTVKVGAEEIPVHMGILAAGSDYFKAMLSHDTVEKQSGVVEFKSLDVESVRKCIDFLYNRDVLVSAEGYRNLMHTAHLLQLHKLCQAIETFYGERLDASSFFDAKQISELYACEILGPKCDQFAMQNFPDIAKFSQFLELEESYISFLIGSPTLRASEDTKCDAVLKWIRHGTEKRTPHLLNLIKLLRLTSLSLGYRRYLTEKESLISESPDCMKLLISSVFDSVHVESGAPVLSAMETTCLALFDTMSKSIRGYNYQDGTWERRQGFNTKMRGVRFSAAVVANYLYTLLQDRSVFRLEYSGSNASWEEMASTTEHHGECPPVVSFDNRLYVVGGCEPHSTTSVEKYDATKNVWSNVQCKNRSCHGSAAVVSQGILYCIGGCNESVGIMRDVERYDMSSQMWNLIAPLLRPRYFPAAVECDKILYVLGGYKANMVPGAEVECYDPAQNVWMSAVNMQVPRGRFTALSNGKVIYAVGGRDNAAKCIELYDPQVKKWVVICRLQNMEIERLATVII